ncbi:MAG: LysM peptidoglycan-binding domain-containing protein [Holophagaceae bacterium]
MPVRILASLLLGMPSAEPPAPQAPVAQASPAVRPPETDPQRIQRLRLLVEAAEKALEDDDEEALARLGEEADTLTADWSLDLLRQPEVQALLQRMKDAQEPEAGDEPSVPEPGLKAQDEVVSITGDELRAELERVRAAEQGTSYDYPIDLNDKVLTWVNLFTTSRRGFMENALGRASMYLPMVRQVFAEEGVPSDLAYLALIESGYRNDANSRAKAVGMWQFIRSTGRIYGLNGTAWVEERRDPIKATRAAARYLKRLYQISGDWYLAASSYNAGPLTLDRAIQNVGSRNFWDLHRSRWLRTETKNYVPELCAAILIGHNPERYGLHVQPLTPYAYETVTVSSMTSLTVLARCAGTDAATLRALNPELLRGSTPPGTYALRVPPGQAVDCLRQLARMPAGQRLDFQNYTVRKGDTLAKVAKKFKLSPEDLLAANDLEAKAFKVGKRLLVPPPPSQALDDRDLSSRGVAAKPLGDRPLKPLPTLPPQLERETPAAGVPAEPLPGKESAPAPAPALAKPAPAPLLAAPVPAPEPTPASAKPTPAPKVKAPAKEAPPAASAKVVYAKAGDTLAKLAREHEVSLGELLRLNPDAATVLHPGDRLQLPEASAAPAPRGPKAPASHVVQKGDTLSSIARKHAVELADLRTWNRLKGDRIVLGQKLRLAP